ncbi:hypothetical protein DFH94DRAFT_497687 [Russula ochroleuca]|uniref:Uncharacterized protein n=1 Tax=Russula ochroleuca TaxID=152965 RepID=A0A9P5MVM9_9AGAM|nr:hypothetical protein DFH94DRAFT_497687 [Russula ochroleuca]
MRGLLVSYVDSHPLKITEHAARHDTGYPTPTNPNPISQDSSNFIDGRPKTAAEKQREKRLRDDPLADLLGPLFVGCKRCGTRIKLSPKSSYDPFHWVKHRERCLRRSLEAVKEILREKEKEDQARSLSAKLPQQHHDDSGPAATVDTPSAAPPRARSPSLLLLSPSSLSSPSLQRRRDADADADSATPPLTADEDEADKLFHSSSRELPLGQGESVSSGSDGFPSPCGADDATPPLCSLSVFRAPDMLAFEDYLHRSRRLPTRLGFPDLLPSPDKWHDWSWGQLRAPVYVVPKRPEETDAAAGADPPLSHGDGDVRDGVLQPDVYSPTGPPGNTP